MTVDGYYLPHVGDVSHKRAKCETALNIVAVLDDGRIDTQGGYPSKVAFIGKDLIAVASVDHDGGATLTVCLIDEFISDHDWIFEDETP